MEWAWHRMAQYGTARYSIVLYGAVRRDAIWCGNIALQCAADRCMVPRKVCVAQ